MVRTYLKCASLCLICFAMAACSSDALPSFLRPLFPKDTPRQQAKAAAAAGPTINPAATPWPGDLNADTKNDLHATGKYIAKVNEMLEEEKFDDLDQLADSLRASKVRFSGGAWKLYILYYGLQYPRWPKGQQDADWEAHIARLKHWIALKPASITARVALAGTYVSYGEHGRGSEFANKVTDEQWKHLNERMHLAQEVLNEAEPLKAKCPQWYLVMELVARYQSWSKERERALVEKAIAFEPLYRSYYLEQVESLAPRWGGEEGEWEQFAEDISTRLGPKQGPMMYYRIAYRMDCCEYRDGALFTKAHLSWDKIKAGYAANVELYGDSLDDMNMFARLCMAAEDRPLAKKMITKIGDNWDSQIWYSKDNWLNAKAWAMQ